MFVPFQTLIYGDTQMINLEYSFDSLIQYFNVRYVVRFLKYEGEAIIMNLLLELFTLSLLACSQHWSTQRAVLQKKLFYSWYFAGKIDQVLCLAGKMKYICWETF